MLEEQKIMKDVFCKFPELQYSFGVGTEVYVKGNKFYNTYSLYIEKKETSEISKNSFYLSTKEKETQWEEIKNEKREKEKLKRHEPAAGDKQKSSNGIKQQSQYHSLAVAVSFNNVSCR